MICYWKSYLHKPQCCWWRSVFIYKQFVQDILYFKSLSTSILWQYEYNFSTEHSIGTSLPPRPTQSQYWESLWVRNALEEQGQSKRLQHLHEWSLIPQQRSTYWNDVSDVQFRVHIHSSPSYQKLNRFVIYLKLTANRNLTNRMWS